MKTKLILLSTFLTVVLSPGSLLSNEVVPEEPPTPAMTESDPASILLTVDSAFSARAREVGVPTAFVEFAAEDAVIYRNGMEPIVGRKAIAKLLGPEEGVSLIWKPLTADMAASGDLGYTLGSFTYKSPPVSGESNNAGHYTGSYVTIWKKQPDGSWKWVFDSGVISKLVEE
ncbi:hypothetical protein G0Q06_10480 [Puniceicoccales bacterium CK1056]|uniref:DUF4440 domain-containing protein n=1 Tax=Oceanipulchritudo coccoides TaxID=2706888 RepID=A0A6B2M462_9BACT|nr:DUF4440 domain-containing protein [Oceanipulchritudo coccoides]NDV62877.1 hypothetical protein [Oceanipulchritudo coccoides]